MSRFPSAALTASLASLTLLLLAFGCAPAAGVEDDATGHAPADVVPGSHEDWCEEHQVPETRCTRCDPSLVAAFKATHDWCAEHGLPESQCTRCDPSRQPVRPPDRGER